MCCPDSYSWSSFLSHVLYSFYNLILLSLACYMLKYTYIYLIQSAKITLLFLFIYVAVFLWAYNQKGNKKQCLEWLVHRGACLVLQAGSCPFSPWRSCHDSASEVVFWHCSSFLFPFHMCFSLGLGFAFSFQKENWNPAITVAERAPIYLH